MANDGEPRRISLIGAECSGKTTLARALADQLPGLWVPELLREFCDLHGRAPRCDEQSGLIRAQIEREKQVQALARRQGFGFIVCDSSPLATALYSAELYDDASLLDEALEHQRSYALTLCTAIDMPWQADGIQRDGPRARESFDARLARELTQRGLAFTRVAGGPRQRVGQAFAAMDRLGIAYNRLATR
jgi:nicotinamide riboside kinase